MKLSDDGVLLLLCPLMFRKAVDDCSCALIRFWFTCRLPPSRIDVFAFPSTPLWKMLAISNDEVLSAAFPKTFMLSAGLFFDFDPLYKFCISAFAPFVIFVVPEPKYPLCKVFADKNVSLSLRLISPVAL